MGSILGIVKELEGKSDIERSELICDYLSIEGFSFERQKYGTGENIYVPSRRGLEIGLCSHFDVVPMSPGANDNASSVAVTFDLLKKFRDYPLTKFGIQGFFFDEEEKGLVGSRAYVHEYGVEKLVGVYNSEMLGQGDRLALWEVSNDNNGLLLRSIEDSARCSGVESYRFDQMTMNDSDHKSFKEAGIESFCVTCVSEGDLAIAAEYSQALQSGKRFRYNDMAEFMGRAPVFKNYHQPTDISEHLSEESLQMASEVIEWAVRRVDDIEGHHNNS